MKKIYILFLLIFNYCNATSILLPNATISGTATVCQNATSPMITFTGSGGTAPYTFIYTINGVAQSPISTTSGNSITTAAATSIVGNFIYNLVSVTDNTGASQNQTGIATITVSSPPIVNFTFTNNNACSDTIIQFNSTVTGSGSYTYSWDFGDGTPISTAQNPTHSFTSLGCGTANFNVVLTISGNGCTVTRSNSVSVKQKPDISFNDVNFPFDPFSNCSNASSNSVYSITVGNSSVSTCIASYVINWGDGNIQPNVTFPISHTYSSIGAYSMIITVTGNNGCINSKTYIVKNVSNPLGGLNSPGSTQNLCAPTSNLQFSISNWGTNSLDTTYTINYGDGSPSLILNQNQLNSSTYYNSTNPASSLNYPIPHIYNTSNCPTSSFVVTLDVTNACGTTPFTLGNISILTKPTANFTAPINGCVNTSIPFINTTIAGYGQNCAQNSIYTWNFGDGSPIITTPLSPPQNINHTFTLPGTYIVTLTAQNFCGTTTHTQTICIEPLLTPSFTVNTNAGCTPLTVTTNNTTSPINQCTPTVYTWSVNHVANNCGAAITPIPNQTATNATFNFIEAGTYTITLTATNSCGSATATQIVTVKKPPTISIATINNSCGTANINPVATVPTCVQPTSSLSYSWSFPGGNPSTSTVANPGTINYSAPGTYSVSLIVTNECGASNTATQNFTVNQSPVITNTNLSQTICSGTATTLVNLTANPSNATFSWTATATPGISGFIASGTNTIPIQSITTTNTSAGTVTYVITPSIGSCTGPPVNYAITVNPSPSITPLPASNSVCVGGTVTPLVITLSSSSVTPTYQWYSNTTNSTTGGIAISGETNASFSPPANASGTFYYYCVVSFTSGGCSTITSSVATINVAPSITISTQPNPNQNICIGGTITTPLSVITSGGTGTPSYQWYSNTTSTTTGGTLISGATNPTFIPPAFSTVGTFYYYVIVSFTGNGCGNATSAIAQIDVVTDPIITSQPIATQTLCQNATPTILTVTASGGSGTFSYQWFSTSTATNSGGNPIGTNTSSFSPPTTAIGTFYYYCTVTQPNAGCNVVSDSATIIINASPTIVNQPSSSTICQNGTPTTLSFTYVNGSGTPTYQWFSNTSNSNSGGTSISGETNPTYVPSSTNVGVFYYYCVITFPNLNGSCSSVPTNVAVITINQSSTIDVQPLPTQTICVGGSITNPLTVSFINGTGSASYQWYSNTTNSTSGGTPVGTNSPNFTPPAFTNVGSFYYYVIISFTGNGCGSITSAIAQIDVVNDPTLLSQPIATQTLCQNTTPTNLTVTATGGIGSNYSYQWHSNTTNNTTTGSLITGATNDTYTPSTANVGTLYYYCIVNQVTGTGCNVTSATAMVVVNLAPAFTNALASSTICLGQTPAPLTVVTNSDALLPTYQWFSNVNNSNSGGTVIVGATNATYNPPAILAGTTYYYCEVTFPTITGGCSIIISSPAEVTINQNPIIAAETSTICSTTTFLVTPTNGNGNTIPSGTTYTWTNPTINPAGAITGASSETLPQTSISQTLINTTTSPATATYTVTPTSGTCFGTSFQVTVTVNPAINPNTIVTNNSCFGVNNASITTNITGGIPPYTISWIGPNSFTSVATSITNLQPGNYNLTITDAGNCPFTNSYTISEPTDIVISNDTINNVSCFGASNGAIGITVSGGTGAYSYSWTQNNTPFTATEDISNLSPATYEVTVSDANSCGPKTATFIITEPPLLQVNLASQTNVDCFGFATGAINIDVVGGTAPYTFLWSNGASTEDIAAIPAGQYDVVVTDSLGCTKNLAITITQSTEIVITAITTPIECYGDNDATITVTLTGGMAPYQIQWSNLAVGLNQNNLSPGNYTITITDALGCQKSLTINIPSPPIFDVNPVVNNISCFGANDGSITLNFVGGIAPVNLVWSDGSPAGTTRNNLSPGTYSVVITDAKPCTISRTFTILEPQILVLSANLTNALDCNNANTGGINLLVSGGTPPFNYVWNNGISTEDLTNIPAGNYSVTVTDSNGCTKTAQYSITRPSPIILAVNTTTIANCSAQSVVQNFEAQVSGGVPPFQFNWSSGTTSGINNELMTTTQDGLVTLTATDAIGCSAIYSFDVNLPQLGTSTFLATSIGNTSYGLYSILDPIEFQSTISGDYISVLWDFGDGTFSNEVNPIHTYLIPNEYYLVTLTVTYPFGCVYTTQLALTVEKGYVLVVPTAFTPSNNDGLNDTLRPVTRGLKNIRLDVYDTWGSLIYSEVGDVLVGWNGKIKDIPSENGNYYVKVSAETFYGTIINENQTFVLIK